MSEFLIQPLLQVFGWGQTAPGTRSRLVARNIECDDGHTDDVCAQAKKAAQHIWCEEKSACLDSVQKQLSGQTPEGWSARELCSVYLDKRAQTMADEWNIFVSTADKVNGQEVDGADQCRTLKAKHFLEAPCEKLEIPFSDASALSPNGWLTMATVVMAVALSTAVFRKISR